MNRRILQPCPSKNGYGYRFGLFAVGRRYELYRRRQIKFHESHIGVTAKSGRITTGDEFTQESTGANIVAHNVVAGAAGHIQILVVRPKGQCNWIYATVVAGRREITS